MPVRRGHVAPQNTFLDTIIRKFDSQSKICLLQITQHICLLDQRLSILVKLIDWVILSCFPELASIVRHAYVYPNINNARSADVIKKNVKMEDT